MHPVTELHIYVFLLPTPFKIQISVSNLFLPRLFFINTNLHFTQHNWGYIRTIELTTEFLEASQPPCIRCIFQIFDPRKSNKGVKMSWQREVKPKWVGISKWGSDSGKNLWGRPLDALFGPCQHLSNLDLMIKRKIKIFVSEIGSLLLKGIWVELPRSITDFRKKYPDIQGIMCVEVEDVNAFSRDCMTGERYGIGWIWQELDLRSASKDLQLRDSGTVWQMLETGQKNNIFKKWT